MTEVLQGIVQVRGIDQERVNINRGVCRCGSIVDSFIPALASEPFDGARDGQERKEYLRWVLNWLRPYQLCRISHSVEGS